MELNNTTQGIQNSNTLKETKQYLTSNLKCPDSYLFTSQKSQNSTIKTPNTPINIYNNQPSYFTIDDKNCDFTKEINPQFKCNILICRGCDLLLGYKTFVVAKEKYFLTLSALLNYRIDPEADDECFLNVYCMGCNEELGIKVKNSYYIYSTMICEKNRIMTAAIISLKKELNDEFEYLLKLINGHLNLQITIHHFHLQKSQLQNFKLQYNYDVCILIHKEEGRLLLFDENGIYNHVYRECFKNTKGNVLFLLLLSEYHNNMLVNNYNQKIMQTNDQSNTTIDSSNRKSSESKISNVKGDNFTTKQNPIWDKDLVKDISENGKQPLLYLLSKNQLVMTIKEQINISQINFLMNFIHNSQYKPLVPSELTFNIGFTKRYLKINIEKCQKSILQYFIKESENKSEFNEVIKQLQQQNQNNEDSKSQSSQQEDSNIQLTPNHNMSSIKNQKCAIY